MRDTTRHTILSVAKIVFAQLGGNNATMDDVAKASGLGRRTIYTYFKTREELYHEVIRNEVALIIEKFSKVSKLNIAPEKKIAKFMLVHMRAIQNLISKDRLLRMEFLTRSEKIEHFRQVIDKHEKECLASIFEEGTQSGVFIVDDFENTAVLALTTLKGLETQFILNDFGKPSHRTLELWQKILFRGIKASA
ncbi:MAG: TetR/AcrR family transcriptional regulator [Mariniphaga sp.]